MLEQLFIEFIGIYTKLVLVC